MCLAWPASAQNASARAADNQTWLAATTTIPKSATGSSEIGGTSQRTRFVIGLDRHATFQVSSLSNPNRVIVELPDVKMQLPTLPKGQAVGLVSAVRGGLAGINLTKVIIDVTTPVVVERAVVERDKSGRAHHLALDIVPVDAVTRAAKGRKPLKAAFALGASGVQPPLPRPAERPEDRLAKAYKPIIVIDPGHGGHDSGAQKFGTIEKHVVLAFGKLLRDKLKATGRYHVLMTRDDDTFVALDERRAFAERHNAALFIAIHADYAGTSARGATIYSLRENVADDLKRSAKGEAAETALTGKELQRVKQVAREDVGTVQSILADLAAREIESTKDRTNAFTRTVIEYMGQSTSLKDNPDRSAAFRVLKTAQFPSVLIELAYVSNRQDAALLNSNAWRNKVSGSIVTAVENYFSQHIARLPM